VAEISVNMKVKNVTLLVPSATLNIVATLFQKYSANLCTTGRNGVYGTVRIFLVKRGNIILTGGRCGDSKLKGYDRQ
jgi:hypothetical protein